MIRLVTAPQPVLGQPHNTKLGTLIYTWSLPAGDTCPGETKICRKRCYAMHGFFLMPSVRDALLRNKAFVRRKEFTPWMIRELQRNHVQVMRIHVAGDFHTATYLRKWAEIIRKSPRVTFLAYTRSWRKAGLLPGLRELAKLPNLRLWFSRDQETEQKNGPPPRVPGVRTAYMAIDDADATHTPADCDLVFRVRYKAQLDPMKKAQGVLVCPAENGVAGVMKHTCTSCGVCWRQPTLPRWEQPQLRVHQEETQELQAPCWSSHEKSSNGLRSVKTSRSRSSKLRAIPSA